MASQIVTERECYRIIRKFPRFSGKPLSRAIFVVGEPDSQLAQLLWIDFGRRLRHEIHAAVVFWKGHYLTDTLFAADQHHDAIEARRDASVRRRTEPERAQQMAEL